MHSKNMQEVRVIVCAVLLFEMIREAERNIGQEETWETHTSRPAGRQNHQTPTNHHLFRTKGRW